MSERRSEIDDERLDAVIEEMARIEAPPGLTARVRASLDAGDERHASGLVFGRRPAWALALSTAALVLIAAAWWMRPAVVRPAVVRPAVVGPAVVGPNFRPREPGRSAEASAKAVSSAAGPASARPGRSGGASAKAVSSARSAMPSFSSAHRTVRAVRHRDDHERALPSLAGPAEVEQVEIDPASLVVPALEVAPTRPISPLIIDTNGRDQSGRGASR